MEDATPVNGKLVSNRIPAPGQKFQHYKGGLYEVITLAEHTEAKEALVVYKSLNYGTVYARPMSVFNELIKAVGVEATLPRFRLL